MIARLLHPVGLFIGTIAFDEQNHGWDNTSQGPLKAALAVLRIATF